MKIMFTLIVLVAMSTGASLAASGDARPAAFDHPLPAEHTVELRTMPAVDEERLRAEDRERAAARRDEPVRFAVAHSVDITPADAGDWNPIDGDLLV